MLESSTVMTPSLPTLSMASAMRSPICWSAAEMAAVDAICSLVSTSMAESNSCLTTASTAFSMPRLRAIGLAPAATLRRPSRTMAWAMTVAVVVPSPATSSVFLATSLTSSAPIFSKGSSSSISLAMDTPSLVIVGAPHFFSRTTLRPLGPRVTLTASARVFIPRSRPRRASSSNAMILAIRVVPPTRNEGMATRCPRRTERHTGAPCRASGPNLTRVAVSYHSQRESANAIIGTRRGRVQTAAPPWSPPAPRYAASPAQVCRLPCPGMPPPAPRYAASPPLPWIPPPRERSPLAPRAASVCSPLLRARAS
ncbi:MAG: hypothetical protein BWY91_03155 [bacterium ADurb.BinA028]|nr:MAG: hypothetical protein BWY91_03155 [bacterium ADurb.BinA028]